jgi:hypothetical protein
MKTVAALLFAITASLCWGQEATTIDRALLAIDGAAKVADFYFTTRNTGLQTVCSPTTSTNLGYCYSFRGGEPNPIARPFVTHGRPLAAGYFAGCFVLDAVLSHELRKHGHPRMARAVLLFGIADNGGAAAWSARESVQ